MNRVQKPISEFVNRRVVAEVGPTALVSEAISAMIEARADCVLITDDGGLQGIFTERDLLKRVVAEGRVPSETTISDVMTSDPEALSSDDCVSYAINLMVLRGFRNVPVVDTGRRLATLGVRDVMSHLTELFEELEQPKDEFAHEWNDIGGG